MSDGTPLALRFAINDRPIESETSYIRFSPYVLSVRTVLPERPLCVELHSVFTGHAAINTHASHLVIGPVGRDPRRFNRDHVRAGVDAVDNPGSCVLEHALQLIEVISAPGRVLTVESIDELGLLALAHQPH